MISESIPHWLSKQAMLAPRQIAIETEKGDQLTFLALQQKSKQFARKLAHAGIKKGVHVGVFSGNHIEMVVAIHALSYLGAVAVLLNTRLTAEELAYQINDGEVSILLTSCDMESFSKTIPVNIDIYTYVSIWELKELQVILQTEIHMNDVFTIIYTSGTTGFPKGVAHTYANHLSSAIAAALNIGLHKNDKWLATLPIFHVGGLSIFIRSVIYGTSVFLAEKFDEEIINEAIFNKGITIISVVTVMMERLIKNLKTEKYPKSFRCMLLGGGPAPKSLLMQAKKHHIPIFQSYGMTETSSQIVTIHPDDALRKIGSAGKPLFSACLKIKNQDQHKIGEIYVKGPMVTKGYFNNPEATRVSFKDGWLATGDLGYIDDEGFLYVIDRRTDLIISGGENVYPAEIESVITSINGIDDVGVTGVKDSKWGQVPAAFIVANHEKITAEEIITYVRERLAEYKVPKYIYFVDKLPRNASRKLVRRALGKLLE